MQATPRKIEVSVTLNGFDYTPAPVEYSYTSEDVVISIVPSSGYHTLQTKVTISGLSVESHQGLNCVFGDVSVPVQSATGKVYCLHNSPQEGKGT